MPDACKHGHSVQPAHTTHLGLPYNRRLHVLQLLASFPQLVAQPTAARAHDLHASRMRLSGGVQLLDVALQLLQGDF